MPNYPFSKSSRLLNAGDFQPVFNQAEFKVANNAFLILARPNHRDSARLGIVVAKKNIRLAVQRNRIKRMIRETFRYRQGQLLKVDAVVLVRKDAGLLSNPQLQKKLDRLWLRLQQSQ